MLKWAFPVQPTANSKAGVSNNFFIGGNSSTVAQLSTVVPVEIDTLHTKIHNTAPINCWPHYPPGAVGGDLTKQVIKYPIIWEGHDQVIKSPPDPCS